MDGFGNQWGIKRPYREYIREQMGIPSYFRRLLHKYGTLVSTKCPTGLEVLCMDFNCLVYTVARDDSTPPPPPPEQKEAMEAWEQDVCTRVGNTMVDIWRYVGKPRQSIICLDGVVPMAKIRQQRMRRFKSAWMKTLVDVQQKENSWDTNCITPGTRFMSMLARTLELIGRREIGSGFQLSSTEDPGEGEHKIMKWIRAHGSEIKGGIGVYGLDADLIVLSLLASHSTSAPMYLMREHQELKGVSPADTNEETTYVFMDLQQMKKILYIHTEEEVVNYVALMSLMGNDFLPHSVTHRLTDDGHDLILREQRSGRRIVEKREGRWFYKGDVLQDIFERWSREEERRLITMIEKKRMAARGPPRRGPDGRPAPDYETLPLKWDVEKDVLPVGETDLVENWRDIYWKTIHPRVTDDSKKTICEEYGRGLAWILAYYTGEEVDTEWMFPAWIPPLWSELAERGAADIAAKGWDRKNEIDQVVPLRPIEQLAMVLPLQSWDLVEDPTLRRLPELAPQMFPTSFECHSFGKRMLWECEILIPTLLPARLRTLCGGTGE